MMGIITDPYLGEQVRLHVCDYRQQSVYEDSIATTCPMYRRDDA